jgi:hypothetical protein
MNSNAKVIESNHFEGYEKEEEKGNGHEEGKEQWLSLTLFSWFKILMLGLNFFNENERYHQNELNTLGEANIGAQNFKYSTVYWTA